MGETSVIDETRRGELREERARPVEPVGAAESNVLQSDWTLPAYQAREALRRVAERRAQAAAALAVLERHEARADFPGDAQPRIVPQPRPVEKAGATLAIAPRGGEILLSDWTLTAYSARQAGISPAERLVPPPVSPPILRPQAPAAPPVLQRGEAARAFPSDAQSGGDAQPRPLERAVTTLAIAPRGGEILLSDWTLTAYAARQAGISPAERLVPPPVSPPVLRPQAPAAPPVLQRSEAAHAFPSDAPSGSDAQPRPVERAVTPLPVAPRGGEILLSDWTLTAYASRHAGVSHAERLVPPPVSPPILRPQAPAAPAALQKDEAARAFPSDAQSGSDAQPKTSEPADATLPITPRGGEILLSDWTLPAYAVRHAVIGRAEPPSASPVSLPILESDWTLGAVKKREDQRRLAENAEARARQSLSIFESDWTLPAYQAREISRRQKENADAAANQPILVSDWTLIAYRLREENRRAVERATAAEARQAAARAESLGNEARRSPEIFLDIRPQREKAAPPPARGMGRLIRRLGYGVAAALVLAGGVFAYRMVTKPPAPAKTIAKKQDLKKRTPIAAPRSEAPPTAARGAQGAATTRLPPAPATPPAGSLESGPTAAQALPPPSQPPIATQQPSSAQGAAPGAEKPAPVAMPASGAPASAAAPGPATSAQQPTPPTGAPAAARESATATQAPLPTKPTSLPQAAAPAAEKSPVVTAPSSGAPVPSAAQQSPEPESGQARAPATANAPARPVPLAVPPKADVAPQAEAPGPARPKSISHPATKPAAARKPQPQPQNHATQAPAPGLLDRLVNTVRRWTLGPR